MSNTHYYPSRITQVSITLLAVFAGIVMLHWLKPVLMPLFAALLLIALVWPAKNWLEKHLPSHVSTIGGGVLLLVGASAFIGMFYMAAQQIVQTIPDYQEGLEQAYQQLQIWLRRQGLPTPSRFQVENLQPFAESLITGLYEVLGYLLMITAFIVLGLPEIRLWNKHFSKHGNEDVQKIISSASETAGMFQRYMMAMMIAGLLDGIAAWLICLSVGLDFALAWGVLAFALTFIPVVGAFLSIVPPTLFALVQFDQAWDVWVVFLGLSGTQILFGIVVEPLIQGRMLSMSAFLLFFSLSFWSFIWGPAGALLATPLTMAIFLVLRHFPSTKWLPKLVGFKGIAKGNGKGQDNKEAS